MEKLKVFTSFTGIGSQEMALKNIGINFEVVGISEVDRYAILGYDAIHNEQTKVETKTKEEMLQEFYEKNIAYNFSTGKSEMPRNIEDIKHLYNAHIRSKNYGDITKIDENTLPDFDLFTYSYPCKNISIAGKQAGLVKGSGTQSALLWECERIIRCKKPKYLLMENVKNLVSKSHIGEFEKWIKTLSEIGYSSYYKVLNGKDYKVPQNRERVIMISILDTKEDYIFPNKIDLNIKLSDILCDISFEDKLFKFSYDKGYNKLVRHKNKVISREMGIPDISSTIHAGYWKFGGRDQFYIRFDNNKIRALSPLECWRLMGFSDEDFYKAKDIGKLSNTKLYERAGRGIVVPMLEEVFKNLFKK